MPPCLFVRLHHMLVQLLEEEGECPSSLIISLHQLMSFNESNFSILYMHTLVRMYVSISSRGDYNEWWGSCAYRPFETSEQRSRDDALERNSDHCQCYCFHQRRVSVWQLCLFWSSPSVAAVICGVSTWWQRGASVLECPLGVYNDTQAQVFAWWDHWSGSLCVLGSLK